jgi:hypothetical protein
MTAIITRYRPTKHYSMLLEWWQAHGWNGIAAKLLPENGWIAVDPDSNVALAAIFIYNDTTTPCSYMEWLIANPNARAGDIVKGIHAVVAKAAEYADFNKRILNTSVMQAGLVRIYESHGFTGREAGMTNLTRGPR